MLDKESRRKIIGLLKEALLAEERAVPIYNRHLTSSLFLAGVPNDKAEKVRSALEVLSRDSIAHKARVEGIITALSKEAENAG